MSNLKYLFVALIFASGISAVKAQDATSEEKPAATTPSSTSGQVLDKIVAKVNNYILLESDVQLAYLEAVAQSQQGFEAPTRCEVFESLLINKLMVAKADLDSITVSDAEVMLQANQRMSMVLQQFGGDEEILAEIYGKTADQLKSEIEEQLKEQLIIQKMQQKITEGLTISPAEVRKFYNSIPRDSLPFFSAEVTVGQIVKKPEVSQHVKDDIIAKMREFRRQIDAGEADFQTLARNNSEDPGSAAQGGELGFFRRGELAPEYEATALSLRPGEISEPIETMFGFHMIQLLERRGNTFNTRHILIRPMPSEDDIKRAEKFLDSLRQQVIDKKIEFSKAAKEHSDDRPTSDNGGFFSDPQNQSNRLTLRTLEDPVLYFTLDSMKVGTITTPMRFEDEREGTKVRVLYYKERYPAHRANMDDDYEKLKAAARRKKEESILSTWFVGAKEDVFIDIDPSYDRCEVLKD